MSLLAAHRSVVHEDVERAEGGLRAGDQVRAGFVVDEVRNGGRRAPTRPLDLRRRFFECPREIAVAPEPRGAQNHVRPLGRQPSLASAAT